MKESAMARFRMPRCKYLPPPVNSLPFSASTCLTPGVERFTVTGWSGRLGFLFEDTGFPTPVPPHAKPGRCQHKIWSHFATVSIDSTDINASAELPPVLYWEIRVS